jgi:SAM-dependent methyltransferase
MSLPAATFWADHWRSLVGGRDTQRGTEQRDGDPTRDPWTGRADRFATYSAELPADDPLFLRLRDAVRPEDTVLDVGAGAGRYAVPLAALAREVVAVEPSPAMRHHLAARLEAAGTSNVAIVGATWPEAEVFPADVTLCAHVVYGVREIMPFLRALDARTRRLCLIAIRIEQHPGMLELARLVLDEERVRQPALIDLYNALAALGIAADVQIGPASSGFRFADHADAAAHYADRLRIPEGERRERLDAALAANLIQGRDGRWRWPGPPPRNAIVSWTPAREE